MLENKDPIHVRRDNSFLYPIGTFDERVTGVIAFVTEDALPVRGSRAQVRVSTKAFRAEPEGTASVRVGLSRYMVRRLARSGEIAIVARIIAANAVGDTTPAIDKFRLVRR
jgi:hypothetical protein